MSAQASVPSAAMPARRLLPLVAPLAVGVLAAACSGAPSASPTSPPPTTSSAASPSRMPEPSDAPAPSDGPAPPATAAAPDPDAEPATAAALADRLVAAEQAIRDPATADVTPWAQAQQADYRTLHHHPDWVPVVRGAIPTDLRPAFDANLRAQEELFALTDPREELPDWRIVAPPPADVLRGHYEAAAEQFGVEWTHLAAIHLTETRMGRIRGVSSAGAQGPMQFMPATWEAYGEGDVDDPADAIRAAARYLVDHGAPADMDGALWAYNHSDRYVAAIQAYASVMRDDPRTYDAYHQWRVYYRLTTGDVVLEEGWTR